MNAYDMAAGCREFQRRYLMIAAIQKEEILKRDFLNTAQLFGNLYEIVEDYIYNGGKGIDFLFKAFELRDKEWSSSLLPKEAEGEQPPEK